MHRHFVYGLLTFALWPTSAFAQTVDITAFVSYSFGEEERGLGYGLEIRGQIFPTLCTEQDVQPQLAFATRLEFRADGMVRTDASVQSGVLWSYGSAHAEAGGGYTFVKREGWNGFLGLDANGPVPHLRLNYDYLRGDTRVSAGLRAMPTGYAFGCNFVS